MIIILNYIWSGIIIISIITSVITGRVSEVTKAMIDGANEGVTLAISLMGIMCFWTGIMKISDKSGFTLFFSILLRPITKILFPKIPQKSEAMNAITMNMTANLFGMSNAATPLGLKAMSELHKLSPSKTASNEICMFVVINTASIEIIPTTILAMQQAAGSNNPFEIIIPVLISSVLSVTVGVMASKLFAAKERL